MNCLPRQCLPQHRHQQWMPQRLHQGHASRLDSPALLCRPLRIVRCVIHLSMQGEGKRSYAFVASPAPVPCGLGFDQLGVGSAFGGQAVEPELWEDPKLHRDLDIW